MSPNNRRKRDSLSVFWIFSFCLLLILARFFVGFSISYAGSFQYPLSPYNPESYYFGQQVGNEYHAGQDCDGSGGTPVYAVSDGAVSYSGSMGGYGWLITVDHTADNVYSLYGHISTRRWKKTSGNVSKGELIGYLADNDEDGGPWGPHLHFGIRNGQKSDYPSSGYSRWMAGYTDVHPTNYEWEDPTSFIQSHASGDHPDLKISELTINKPGESSTRDLTLQPGERFEIKVKVKNVGEGDAGAFKIKYLRSGDKNFTKNDKEIGRDEVDSLDAGDTHEDRKTNISAPSDPGTYYIGAWADCDEDDNGDNDFSDSDDEIGKLVVEGVPPQPPPGDDPYGFEWSYAGPIAMKHCIQINEPADPDTWADNYLCMDLDLGIAWSAADPIGGMQCTLINEPADPEMWHDNYLCLPTASSMNLYWSAAGPVSGKYCVQIYEPADPHTWDDNYLCYDITNPVTESPSGILGLQWSWAGPVSSKHCIQINEPADPHTWADNYLCSNDNYGIAWSAAGPIAGMRCTQILEPADPDTWDDNYLCVPNDSGINLQWSGAGPIGGKSCVNTAEPADPEMWGDNYLCYDVTTPAADFNATPTSGTAPLTVNFNDASQYPNSWSWNFGDSATSANQNPTHTYSTPGYYTVSLTVTGPGGSDTETKNNYIQVNDQPPTAYFYASPTSGQKPLTVKFTSTCSGIVSSFSWNFGDGGTSAAQHPTHTYNRGGTFTVKLTATGAGGSDTETKKNYITVSDPNAGKPMPWLMLLLDK